MSFLNRKRILVLLEEQTGKFFKFLVQQFKIQI